MERLLCALLRVLLALLYCCACEKTVMLLGEDVAEAEHFGSRGGEEVLGLATFATDSKIELAMGEEPEGDPVNAVRSVSLLVFWLW